METTSKIFVAGARGLVGSALLRELHASEYHNLLTPPHCELDLTNPAEVKHFFSVHQPEYVFFCAAKVGGIADNVANPIDFLVQNLHMELNVFQNASEYGCKKLLFLATSCAYPRDCPQPIREEYFMTGPLEKTTEAYSIAKIAGIKLCQFFHEQYGDNFVSVLPCNLFGEKDNFDEGTAHCLPGLIARMAAAKLRGDLTFSVWGSGAQQRELLYAGDLAKALITIMQSYSGEAPINAGSGLEMTIKSLAVAVAGVVKYEGDLVFDSARPEGSPRRILDSSKLRALGWEPVVPFLDALNRTYRWYVTNS